ncbi:hypothetical protein CLV85_1352 [Salinibacterium amurskyense]|uniref:DUF4190 domain-containing protein n=2 Tax=Salinibacterium amurskyense TaxID=205941 RepID=A0A2M9D8X3_9MICO|nr:hypothetical protein CLV85_1352 [Salinibacterium amurskyense]
MPAAGATSTALLSDTLVDDERASFADAPAADSTTPMGGSSAPSGTAASAASAPEAAASDLSGFAMPRRTSTRTMSVLALSLGIASFFFAQSIVVPLAAVILGVFGLRDEPTGRGFSIWGIVLACVATFGWVLVVAAGALAVLPFVFLAAAF